MQAVRLPTQPQSKDGEFSLNYATSKSKPASLLQHHLASLQFVVRFFSSWFVRAFDSDINRTHFMTELHTPQRRKVEDSTRHEMKAILKGTVAI